jgi:hypothetical protein
VWQDRFKSPVIEADEQLLTVLRYMEANPWRAGMVRDLTDTGFPQDGRVWAADSLSIKWRRPGSIMFSKLAVAFALQRPNSYVKKNPGAFDSTGAENMTQWHPLFAELLRPLFEDYYDVQTNVPVGDVPREADIVLLQRTVRGASPTLPGGNKHGQERY